MKKTLLSLTSLFTLFLAACSQTDTSTGERDQVIDQLDPKQGKNVQNTSDVNDKLGFVNYKNDQLNEDEDNNRTVKFDRTQMADTIARLILDNEGFNQVAALVTDEHVLIAYDRDEGLDQKVAADIAKQTAVSIMPGFYDVYVSDNDTLIQDIQSLHNSTPTRNEYDNTINQLIKEMKKTPQGIPKEDKMD